MYNDGQDQVHRNLYCNKLLEISQTHQQVIKHQLLKKGMIFTHILSLKRFPNLFCSFIVFTLNMTSSEVVIKTLLRRKSCFFKSFKGIHIIMWVNALFSKKRNVFTKVGFSPKLAGKYRKRGDV